MGRLKAQRTDRRSSFRTLFEVRGRTWIVRSLLCALLGIIAFALTWLSKH